LKAIELTVKLTVVCEFLPKQSSGHLCDAVRLVGSAQAESFTGCAGSQDDLCSDNAWSQPQT